MIHFNDGKQISIYEYLWLMRTTGQMMSLIKDKPDTVVETNHFMMDIMGGPVFKF
jgi:hypothetical protein